MSVLINEAYANDTIPLWSSTGGGGGGGGDPNNLQMACAFSDGTGLPYNRLTYNQVFQTPPSSTLFDYYLNENAFPFQNTTYLITLDFSFASDYYYGYANFSIAIYYGNPSIIENPILLSSTRRTLTSLDGSTETGFSITFPFSYVSDTFDGIYILTTYQATNGEIGSLETSITPTIIKICKAEETSSIYSVNVFSLTNP